MTEMKIAIACQGGGGQTAFTAGVLKTLFDNDLPQIERVRILERVRLVIAGVEVVHFPHRVTAEVQVVDGLGDDLSQHPDPGQAELEMTLARVRHRLCHAPVTSGW
jgi:hypothetical protein